MSDLHPLDAAIQKTNQRLKAARLGLQIERRGEKLSLRGTLPPRPGSSRLKPYQQRIPLGYPANKAGLKQVEQAAKLVAARLIENSFDWRIYLGFAAHSADSSLAEKLEAFEQEFLHQTPADAHRAAQHRTTWQKAYRPYLRKLLATHQQQPRLSIVEAIYTTIEAIPRDARSRQVCCTALQRFADFCEIELPTQLKASWGAYSHSRTQIRQLPSEAEILQGYEQIPNPAWRFVYGVMATYGLRNHEVFFCDYSTLQARQPESRITVLETTKTGLHDVWPFPPEWVDAFNLHYVNLPGINLDLQATTLQRIGQQVSVQFRRYGLPFSPYDLRHAWAVRTIHFGLPDTVAAKMMGHSVAIHNRTYHRWITLRDQQQAVRNVLQQR